MRAEQLLDHFDRISDAPDAVPRLRSFVLELAVRGKLAPQETDDEPAESCLSRLGIESTASALDGFVVGDKTLPPSWSRVRFEDVATISGGVTLGRKLGGRKTVCLPYLRVANVQRGGFDLDIIKEVSIAENEIERYSLRKNDLLMTEGGDWDKVGRAAIWDEQIPLCLHQNHVFRARMRSSELLPIWFERYFNSPDGRRYFESASKQTTNLASINIRQVRGCPIPLPPLAEQRRIVAKVDELMALCDQLEAAQAERESRRDRLAAASLDRLNNGADAGAFREHARFHLRHLPRLATRPEHVKQLRQTILNLAVRGRLVAQDPSDEPATDVLQHIQAVKRQLEAKDAIKKDKKTWDGLPKEPPFDIPSNWSWSRLQDVFEISRGGSPRPAGDSRYFGGPIPWITVREITKDSNKYLASTESGLTEEGAAKSRFINPGDLLLTNSGATLGVPKISRIKACMNDGVAVLRLFHSVDLNDFAYFYLTSQTEAFRRVNQGMGQPNLNTPIIAGWFFPFPPIAEQRRIVARVDELLALCDQLEAALAARQTESRRLLEALIHEALAVSG